MKNNIINFLFYIFLIISFVSCGNNTSNNKNFVYNIKETSFNGIYIPIVEIPINDDKKFFIVDTGANISMIDANFYEKNKEKFEFIKNIDITINGIAGDKSVSEKYVIGNIGDSIKIQHQFMTSDLSDMIENINSICGFDIVGIIGSDLLHRFDFCVDFNNNALYINRAPIDSILSY